MKNALIALFALSFSFSALASAEGIAAALNSPALRSLEVRLANEDYELKSIVSTEAGESFRSQRDAILSSCEDCGYIVTFKRVQQGDQSKVLVKDSLVYRLKHSAVTSGEEPTLIQEISH